MPSKRSRRHKRKQKHRFTSWNQARRYRKERLKKEIRQAKYQQGGLLTVNVKLHARDPQGGEWILIWDNVPAKTLPDAYVHVLQGITRSQQDPQDPTWKDWSFQPVSENIARVIPDPIPEPEDQDPKDLDPPNHQVPYQKFEVQILGRNPEDQQVYLLVFSHWVSSDRVKAHQKILATLHGRPEWQGWTFQARAPDVQQIVEANPTAVQPITTNNPLQPDAFHVYDPETPPEIS